MERERGSFRPKKEKESFKISTQTQDYYVFVSTTLLEDNFEDAHDKARFIKNVFNEVAGKEVALSCNATTSRVLELIIEHASAAQISAFLTSLKDAYHKLIFDDNGSHVVQKLLLHLSKHVLINSDAAEDSMNDSRRKKKKKKPTAKAIAPALDLCAYITRHIYKTANNKIASHVVRSLIDFLRTFQKFEAQSSAAKKSIDIINDDADAALGTLYQEFLSEVYLESEDPETFSKAALKLVTSKFLNMVFQKFMEALPYSRTESLCKRIIRAAEENKEQFVTRDGKHILLYGIGGGRFTEKVLQIHGKTCTEQILKLVHNVTSAQELKQDNYGKYIANKLKL